MIIDRPRAYKNKIKTWGQVDSRWRKYKATGRATRHQLHESKVKRQQKGDQSSFGSATNPWRCFWDRPALVSTAIVPNHALDTQSPDLQLNIVDSLPATRDSQLNALDSEGKTKLHYAVEDDDFLEVSYLLSMGAAVDHVDREGDTSLVIATKRGYTSLMELLLKHGANADFSGKDGRRPVHLCLLRPTELQVLLSANADPNGADEDGNTALHLIFQRSEWLFERAEVGIHMLLSHGANVNAPNVAGDTPLHLVIKNASPLQLSKYIYELSMDGSLLSLLGRKPFRLLVDRAAADKR